MTPKQLIEIYKTIWALQTASGIKIIEADRTLALSAVNDLVDKEFEKHRLEAYQSVLLAKPENELEAQTTMVKAWITFVASPDLAGYT